MAQWFHFLLEDNTVHELSAKLVECYTESVLSIKIIYKWFSKIEWPCEHKNIKRSGQSVEILTVETMAVTILLIGKSL